MTRTEKLLAELIALPSVNPAFLPPRHPLAGERQVADFLAATAARAGLEVEFKKLSLRTATIKHPAAPMSLPGYGRETKSGKPSCWRRT